MSDKVKFIVCDYDIFINLKFLTKISIYQALSLVNIFAILIQISQHESRVAPFKPQNNDDSFYFSSISSGKLVLSRDYVYVVQFVAFSRYLKIVIEFQYIFIVYPVLTKAAILYNRKAERISFVFIYKSSDLFLFIFRELTFSKLHLYATLVELFSAGAFRSGISSRHFQREYLFIVAWNNYCKNWP